MLLVMCEFYFCVMWTDRLRQLRNTTQISLRATFIATMLIVLGGLDVLYCPRSLVFSDILLICTLCKH